MPLKQDSNASVTKCPFSNKTNLHLELPGKMVPTVPVSGSGSVPGPPCQLS